MCSSKPETEELDAVRSWLVSEEQLGQRLDRWLVSQVRDLGRSRSQLWIEQGRVRVNGRVQPKSYLLTSGDRVELRPGGDGRARPVRDVQVEYLFVSEQVAVMNKPAGLCSAALPDREERTAAGVFLARFPEMAQVGYGPREPGLVHRLDTFTSGVLVGARTPAAFEWLTQTLRAGLWVKRYLALVLADSLSDQGVIRAALETDPQDRRRVRWCAPSERNPQRESQYRVLLRGARLALVEVQVSAASRHQVRAHLSGQGAPLLGDVIYGGAAAGLAPRHALHASYVSVSGSGAAAGMAFACAAPLPEDLVACLLADGVPGERLQALHKA